MSTGAPAAAAADGVGVEGGGVGGVEGVDDDGDDFAAGEHASGARRMKILGRGKGFHSWRTGPAMKGVNELVSGQEGEKVDPRAAALGGDFGREIIDYFRDTVGSVGGEDSRSGPACCHPLLPAGDDGTHPIEGGGGLGLFLA